MKKVFGFVRRYPLAVVALVAIAMASGLTLGGQPVTAHWLLGIVAIGEVLPLLWGMAQALRDGTYGIDILAATAIVSSVLFHQYWAGMVIVLMLTGGEALEDYAEGRARVELSALLAKAPQQAHVLRGRKTIDIAAAEVEAGDKIIIKPGELVPVDALVIEGSASFDESSLTGESLPQVKSSGEQLLSGSINLDGAITAKALRPAAESQYEQIIKLVRAAASSQARFVRLADRYSVPFTLAAFAIAGAAWALSGQSIRFLEVLVVATPCPLILAAPVAIISGMSRSAKQGIIVKSGSALERFAQAKTFAFDKTGTLTTGTLAVESVKTFDSFSSDKVLVVAATLEQNSNHVLARAIVAAAAGQNLRLARAKSVQELAGLGLTATLQNQEVLVGRLRLMQDNHITFPAQFNPKHVQQTAAFVAIDGRLAGVISFRDNLRPESKRTLAQLKTLGIKNLLMITGDNQTTARAIAAQLGIHKVEAEALPADKLHIVEHIKDRPVVFVGDGVNDAPVLTAADIGIALGARGETAASEAADLVIMQDDVEQVARGFAIARRTLGIARQSVFVGVGLSVVLMLIFASGRFRPIYGAGIQEVVDVIVIFNALRAHSAKLNST